MTISMESVFSKILATWLAKISEITWQNLTSEDPIKEVLEKTYKTFKERFTQDDTILGPIFKAFFTDDRTISLLKPVFSGQGELVEFHLLNEIFVQLCDDQKIELKDFNVYHLLAILIKELETQAQQHPAFQQTFQVEYTRRMVTLLEKRGAEQNLSDAQNKYLRHLIHAYNPLVFSGIPDLKEKKDIPLPEVFVMQRALESVPVDQYENLYQEKLRDRDDNFTGHELQLRRFHFSLSETRSEAVKFDQVLKESENRRFVILGKPGSGKSSLLKFLLLAAAQNLLDNPRESESLCLPILVEIRKFENALSKTTQVDYNILDYLYDSMRKQYSLTLPEKFFETWLDKGRVLLMFDGLDEVAAESRRMEIRQMIASFVVGRSKGNTVIVTSRITGYQRAHFSTQDYRHFTLEDFNDEEIHTFIQNWYNSRLSNAAEVTSKVLDLSTALEKKPRIKILARNPLLLTIIGIIHRYEAQLPEDRLLLYHKATEAMLYTWDNVKDIIDEKFKLADKRLFLEKVAFHLQSIEKGDEAGTVMEQQEVYKLLFPDFCRIFCCEKHQAKELVDQFLDSIRSRAGLLTEQAPDQFGFVHKTFQEYFAAQWIANESVLNFDLQILINYVDRYMDNAFWHETLLLAIRALPNKQALKVLDHILKRDPLGIETDFYHNHYFVMTFLAEQARWLDNPVFVETQINDFFNFSWNNGKERSYYSHVTFTRFIEWVTTVTDSMAVGILKEKLLPLAEDQANKGFLRSNCAEALGNLGEKEKAVEILLTMAEDHANSDELRGYCALALGKLGKKEKTMVDRLMTLAEDNSINSSIRGACTQVLGKLWVKEKSVLARLLTLSEDQTNPGYLRRSSALVLGKFGEKEKTAKILLTLAEDKAKNAYFRRDCAKALGKLGVKEQSVVDRLLKLAEDQTNSNSVRRSSAQALGKLGVKKQAVVDRLLKLAEARNNERFLRHSCAEALGNLEQKDKAIEILLALAENQPQNGDLNFYCALTLGDLGEKEKAVDILLTIVEDQSKNSRLRRYCAKAIGNFGKKEKVLVDRILILVEDTANKGSLRSTCALAMGNLGEKEKALSILINLYNAQKDKMELEARRIYHSLWKLTEVKDVS